MKKYLLLGIILTLLSPSLARANSTFKILRVKAIPNPFPAEIAGEEILEVKFQILSPGWVSGVGWCVRTFNDDKETITTQRTAYFYRPETPLHRIRNHRFKGQSSFTAYFPRPAAPAFTVVILGNRSELESALLPSADLIEEFNLSRNEMRKEVNRSEYRILEGE